MAYIFIAILIAGWAWFGYEINKAPLIEDEDAPKTAEWHDDDYHPDVKL
jgi:hypothetical protein